MKCSKCGSNNDSVVDSRHIKSGKIIRRRRKCICGTRWTTHEFVLGESPTIRPLKNILASIKSMQSQLIKLELRIGMALHETEDNEGSKDPVVNGSSVDLGRVP